MLGTILGCSRWLALLAMLLVAMPAHAQTAGKTLDQKEVDALVETITRAVVEKLKAEGIAPAGRPAASPAPPVELSTAAEADAFKAKAQRVFRAFPSLPGRIGTALGSLDRSTQDGYGTGVFLLLLAAAFGVALLAEFSLWTLLSGVRRMILRGVTPPVRPGRLLALAGTDLAGVLAFWAVAIILHGVLFAGAGAQSALAASALNKLVLWRLGMAILRVWLRPENEPARLAPLDAADARRIMFAFAAGSLALTISSEWTLTLAAGGLASEGMGAAQLLNNPLAVAILIACVLYMRDPMARWLERLAVSDGYATAATLAIIRNWHIGGIVLVLVLAVAQIYGALAGRLEVPAGLSATINLILGLLLAETLLDYFAMAAPAEAGARERHRAPRLVDVALNAVRVLIRIAVVISIVRIWAVDVTGYVDLAQFAGFRRAAISVGVILFAAYVLWELLAYFVATHGGTPHAGGVFEEDAEPGGQPSTATRLQTLLPLLKIGVAILIIAVAGLLVLSELGVNITPLIAGASIFGLALSFGSQTLVRDIVSGVFYLADDAFRTGEYIDVGKAKGTVEGFTLRSVKLRHQNGQVQTIPFGQLGQITNFSRDWTTVKFNLRFARETDIEVLRKVTKKIGQEMQADPEFADDFLAPLKMQGVADILDNALVVRFKFTVKPGRPSFIQRTAVKRMIAAFAAKGIEFSHATVAVQTLGQQADLALAAAAASAATTTQQAVPQPG